MEGGSGRVRQESTPSKGTAPPARIYPQCKKPTGRPSAGLVPEALNNTIKKRLFWSNEQFRFPKSGEGNIVI